MKLFSIFSKIASIFICVIYTSQSSSASIASGDFSITTSNLPSEMSQKFSLKKISTHQDQNKLPEEFRKVVMATDEYDYYYAISPTKGSGGYIFEIENSKKEYRICLRAPMPMSAVTMALATPIALIKVQKGVKIDPTIIECK
jgi:predicted ATP-grasp superfamily ATP-dependent carboligase